MCQNPAKDFGPIADDYAFFERHATELREDVRAYAESVQGLVTPGETVRLLDFGCGTGTVTAALIAAAGWPAARLQLSLVEPVESARRQAMARLSDLAAAPVEAAASLPADVESRFDIVLANHVLYYVPDLPGHVARLIAALKPAGRFITAIASRRNVLIEFWAVAFRLLGREIPHHTAENVEAVLQDLGVRYQQRSVEYELAFDDTAENRMRILRFLLADHLPRLPLPPMLGLFDRYSRSGRVRIHTESEHFTTTGMS